MQIVLATRNLGKVAEFERLLVHAEIQVLGLTEFHDMPDVAETGSTLAENSLLKAEAIAEFTGLPSLADDSGLFVEALNGDPGIYSARWAGAHGDDRANLEKVLGEMAEIKAKASSRGERYNDRAAFKTAVTLVLPAKFLLDGERLILVEHGEMAGRIIESPRGEHGFGYDPIFVPDGYDLTSAELTPEQKDVLSHRGKAMRSMATRIQELLPNLAAR